MPPKKNAVPVIPLDPRYPPRRIRHKRTGVVTEWSTLLRDRLSEFEPFYRKGSNEQLEHSLLARRFEAQEAMRHGGDPFAGMGGPGFSMFGGEDHGDAAVDGT